MRVAESGQRHSPRPHSPPRDSHRDWRRNSQQPRCGGAAPSLVATVAAALSGVCRSASGWGEPRVDDSLEPPRRGRHGRVRGAVTCGCRGRGVAVGATWRGDHAGSGQWDGWSVTVVAAGAAVWRRGRRCRLGDGHGGRGRPGERRPLARRRRHGASRAGDGQEGNGKGEKRVRERQTTVRIGFRATKRVRRLWGRGGSASRLPTRTPTAPVSRTNEPGVERAKPIGRRHQVFLSVAT